MFWKEYNFDKIIAISDPHAHLNTLIALINKIKEKHPNTPIFIIGDMIDKGKRAKDLIQLVMSTPNIYALLGNHDHFMLVESRPTWKKYESLWLYNDGQMSHRSYGGKWRIKNDTDLKLNYYNHIAWLKTLPLVASFPNIKINNRELILSHAGIDLSIDMAGSISNLKKILNELPADSLKNHIKDTKDKNTQIALEILWNRLKDENSVKDFGIFNVFGHTTQENVLIKEHFACIDTHVYKPNKLSALVLPSLEIIEQETLEDTWEFKS